MTEPCKIDNCKRSTERRMGGRAGLCHYHYVSRTPEKKEHNRLMHRKRCKKWNDNNKEQRHNIWRKYYEKNKRTINLKSVRWRNNNLDKSRATRRLFYRRHKEKLNKKHKRDREQQKLTVFLHYTNNNIRCMCDCKCTENNITMLTIDHINNDGYTKRGRDYYTSIINKGFPPTYTILCWNCNIGRAHNKGICPRIPKAFL